MLNTLQVSHSRNVVFASIVEPKFHIATIIQAFVGLSLNTIGLANSSEENQRMYSSE